MSLQVGATAASLLVLLGCGTRTLRQDDAGTGGVSGSSGSTGSGGSMGGGAAGAAGSTGVAGSTGGGGSGGAPTQGACGGPLPTAADIARYCAGVDQLSLSDVRIVYLDGDQVISPGETFDVSVLLTNVGDTGYPRIGLITTRADFPTVGDNPYPPQFSFGRGSLRVTAGEVRIASTVPRGTRAQLFACVTGPSVDCPDGSRFELSVTVE